MVFRFVSISAALALFTLLLLNGAQELTRKKKLRIILITAESLRSDMVTEENCPHLLAAAKVGYTFNNYRAISGWTGTNIVSLLSGLTPFQSGIHTRGQSVDPALDLPLEQLKRDGYAVTGLQPFMAMDIYQNLGLSVAETSPDPLLWLANQSMADKPYFFWYHYVHTHLPYTQPPGSQQLTQEMTARSSTAKKRIQKVITQSAVHFDEAVYPKEEVELIHKLQQPNIQGFDQWFENFWRFYNSGGLQRNTLLIVTADHGDEHGERQMVGHASTTLKGHLHEEIVHIPLFIWLPASLDHRKTDTSQLASHIDIMPTLLDLLGRQQSPLHSGISLFANDTGKKTWTAITSSGGFAEPDPGKIRYFEYSHIQDYWKSRVRIFEHPERPDQTWLYDLRDDKHEVTDLSSAHPQIIQEHLSHIKIMRENQESRPVQLQSVEAEKGELKVTLQPRWKHPATSGNVSFKQFEGRFFLQWTGSPEKTYILEYRAGYGAKALQGTLEVDGNVKDFGTISTLYWNTWIVPNGPYNLRVKETGGPWSSWLKLEASP